MLLPSIPVNSVVTGRVSVCRYKMRLVQEGVTVLVKAPWQESRTSAHVLFGVGNIELTVSAEGEVCPFSCLCWFPLRTDDVVTQLSTQSSIGVEVSRVSCSVHTPTDANVTPTSISGMMKGPRLLQWHVVGCSVSPQLFCMVYRICAANAKDSQVSC
jgi:hypothetical protein